MRIESGVKEHLARSMRVENWELSQITSRKQCDTILACNVELKGQLSEATDEKSLWLRQMQTLGHRCRQQWKTEMRTLAPKRGGYRWRDYMEQLWKGGWYITNKHFFGKPRSAFIAWLYKECIKCYTTVTLWNGNFFCW